MDADTRHELKQNELAEALTKLRGRVKDEHVRLAILIVTLAVVAIIAVRYWRYSANRTVERGWSQLGAIEQSLSSDTDTDADAAITRLRALVGEASDPTLKGFAKLRLGNALRDQGMIQPQKRATYFAEATSTLQQVISENPQSAALCGAATFSLACVQESERKFDEARASYKKLVDEPRFDGSPFRIIAKSRLEDMDKYTGPVSFVPGEPPPPPPPPTLTPPATSPAPTATPPSPLLSPTNIDPKTSPPASAPAAPASAPGQPGGAGQESGKPAATPTPAGAAPPATQPAPGDAAGKP